MKKRHLITATVAGLITTLALGSAAVAQEVTLRLHQFLPPQAVLPSKIIVPWAEKRGSGLGWPDCN